MQTAGLVHLRHPDYQPATGQFLSPDPLDGVPGSTLVNSTWSPNARPWPPV